MPTRFEPRVGSEKTCKTAVNLLYFSSRGNSSVGRASPCQGECRGFESRFPLCLAHARHLVAREERVAMGYTLPL
jgi:hypothetical protein